MQAILRLNAKTVMAVVALMLMTTLAQAERQVLDRVIAIVDDGVILKSELDARVSTITSRLSGQGTGLPPRQVLEERVLDQLITESIQLQMADNMGMRISDNELNETLQRIARSNNMTLDQFERQLAAEGVTYQEAREQIRREILASRVQQRRVDSRVRVTDREVQNYLEQMAGNTDNTEYLFAHILVAVDNFANQQEVRAARDKVERLRQEIDGGRDFQSTAVAESDASNALEGGVMGWRSRGDLPSLVSNVVPGLPQGQVSDVLESGSGFHLVMVLDTRGGEERSVVTQHRVRHILVRTTEVVTDERAERRINELYRQIQDGDDFAALAREFSNDPGSASEGGNLGWVGPGQMVPEFEQAMTSAREGQVTRPFRSQFGWHILEVQDRRERDISDQVRESEARQAIYRRKFETELQNWLREIRDEAFVEIKS